MDDIDALDGDAELVSHHLGERRVMALPVTMAAGHHRNGTGRVDAHGCRFVKTSTRTQRTNEARWRNAAGFDVVGNTDAA